MEYYVYILAHERNGTLYIGSTNNLVKRVWEHKQKLADGFTKRYGIDRLVYYEVFNAASPMVMRERQLKQWNRLWKLKLIESTNPDWNDLYSTII